jgi:hypothetical protein
VLGELVEEGFTLALDNFAYRPELEPLLRLASVATLDIQALDREGQADHVRRLRGHGLTVIAEKVETRDELEHCLADLLASCRSTSAPPRPSSTTSAPRVASCAPCSRTSATETVVELG